MRKLFEIGGGDTSTAAFTIAAPTPKPEEIIEVHFGRDWEVSGYAIAWHTPLEMTYNRLQEIAAVHVWS